MSSRLCVRVYPGGTLNVAEVDDDNDEKEYYAVGNEIYPKKREDEFRLISHSAGGVQQVTPVSVQCGGSTVSPDFTNGDPTKGWQPETSLADLRETNDQIISQRGAEADDESKASPFSWNGILANINFSNLSVIFVTGLLIASLIYALA